MSLVVDKYITKKENDLLEYAKILDNIIKVDNNKMWRSKKEFSEYAKNIIEIYASKYYFENNLNRDNPIEYSNDNINLILKSVIEYCRLNEKMNMLNTWKNETFLLSVIICSACYVDFATNIVDGDYNDTKAKFKYLLEYLKKTKILHISDNKYLVNDLFEAIKKNTSEDRKVFESIEGDNYSNEYIKVNESLYKVKFNYNIPGLDGYDEILVNNTLKGYETKFLEMSIELLTFQVLKDLISNKDMTTYLVDISNSIKKNTIKLLDNDYLKEYIKVLVPLEDSDKYQDIIELLKSNNISLVYEYDGNTELNDITLMGVNELLMLKQVEDIDVNLNDITLIKGY